MKAIELKGYSNAELLALMDRLLLGPEQEFDDELFDAAEALVNERAPLQAPDTTWEAFQARNADALETVSAVPPAAQKPRRWMRRLGTVAATVAIVFGLLIGAQASGLDVFGAMARWTGHAFRTVVPAANPDLEQVREELEQRGIPSALAPTWVPDGFRLTDSKFLELRDNTLCRFIFEHAGQTLTLEFRKAPSGAIPDPVIDPPNGYPVEEFTTHSRTFYIFSAYEGRVAVWSDGDALSITFTGNISKEDMQFILDSMAAP